MTNQTTNSEPTWSVAIIDDAFAKPDRESVESALSDFCDSVNENGNSDALDKATGFDFLDPALVDDGNIAALFDHRSDLSSAREDLNSLFSEFDNRRNALSLIKTGISKFPDVSVTEFRDIVHFKTSEDRFRVVFLDFRLKGANESVEIAKQLYTNHRAFIVLMSDQPDATGNRETEFREQVGLLQGFFKYVPKEELVDPDAVYRTMTFVPENPMVCHAIHDLIDGLEQTLAGDGNQVSGRAVVGFMDTVRNLPLQDYALLCELTLADEGHPLGDYIRRLFGSHLVEQVFTTDSVAKSLKALDALRFTEFLPLAGEPSDSLKELYAASLVEPITNPWGEHPWENETAEGEVDAEG